MISSNWALNNHSVLSFCCRSGWGQRTLDLIAQLMCRGGEASTSATWSKMQSIDWMNNMQDPALHLEKTRPPEGNGTVPPTRQFGHWPSPTYWTSLRGRLITKRRHNSWSVKGWLCTVVDRPSLTCPAHPIALHVTCHKLPETASGHFLLLELSPSAPNQEFVQRL